MCVSGTPEARIGFGTKKAGGRSLEPESWSQERDRARSKEQGAISQQQRSRSKQLGASSGRPTRSSHNLVHSCCRVCPANSSAVAAHVAWQQSRRRSCGLFLETSSAVVAPQQPHGLIHGGSSSAVSRPYQGERRPQPTSSLAYGRWP